jgi:hypothetical protein
LQVVVLGVLKVTVLAVGVVLVGTEHLTELLVVADPQNLHLHSPFQPITQ